VWASSGSKRRELIERTSSSCTIKPRRNATTSTSCIPQRTRCAESIAESRAGRRPPLAVAYSPGDTNPRAATRRRPTLRSQHHRRKLCLRSKAIRNRGQCLTLTFSAAPKMSFRAKPRNLLSISPRPISHPKEPYVYLRKKTKIPPHHAPALDSTGRRLRPLRPHRHLVFISGPHREKRRQALVPANSAQSCDQRRKASKPKPLPAIC